jgi:hypothetical protein
LNRCNQLPLARCPLSSTLALASHSASIPRPDKRLPGPIPALFGLEACPLHITSVLELPLSGFDPHIWRLLGSKLAFCTKVVTYQNIRPRVIRRSGCKAKSHLE